MQEEAVKLALALVKEHLLDARYVSTVAAYTRVRSGRVVSVKGHARRLPETVALIAALQVVCAGVTS